MTTDGGQRGALARYIVRLAPRPKLAVLLAAIWGFLAVLNALQLIFGTGEAGLLLPIVTMCISGPLAIGYTAAAVLHRRAATRDARPNG